MSAVINGEGVPLAVLMDDLIRDLMDFQLWMYITAASSALIFYDWLLTSHEEMTFVWRRRGNPYVRILFVGARYAAIASAILSLLSVGKVNVNVANVWVDLISVICSELIFVLRTWAIWERSRPILVFLIGLIIACVASAIVIIQLSRSEALVTPIITLVFNGSRYTMPVTNIKFAQIESMPYILILVLQSTVLSLTLYRVLRYRKDALKQSRSTLVDVLWIDGTIYFIFIFLMSLLNVGLALQVSHPILQSGLIQLQTVLHSVLSTRVVLHTATVLRQEIVDSRASLAQGRSSTGMRFAAATIEQVPKGVELQDD